MEESGVVSTYIIPQCDDVLKPMLGMSFVDFDVGVQFYKVYAEACGFDIRKGTTQHHPRDGSVIRQYVYCNREGFNKPTTVNMSHSSSSQTRRRVSYRCDCMARISFVFDAIKGCVVERLEEGHTHQMVSEKLKFFLKVNRNLGYQEQNFNLFCARANIGPGRAYRLFKEAVGDFSQIGSTAIDWKNFSRDRKAFIVGCDAQLILQKMALKKESCNAFFYAYTVDEHDRLKCLFWADPIARRNYSVFGDVVSFDCTYGTNRYNMIFAPFTGKDNHGKIITFGAALLPGEDNTVYAWVFKQFNECMGRSPSMIITDQDPAMKIAVQQIFIGTVHRLCMWHIMRKVPEKTPPSLRNNEDFRKRLNDTVWSNTITTTRFEQEWVAIMVDFELTNERWFCDLFTIRKFWIPAYFRDLPMSGICRTTSISESVNSFFGDFLSRYSNLVEFFMHFESALDAQRESNARMNSLDRDPSFVMKTPMSYEKHAASIYTTSVFYKVQNEIEDSISLCSVKGIQVEDALQIIVVDDGSDQRFNVSYKEDDETVECSCNKYIRDGLLCSHIFSLFKHFKWVAIPDKYVMPRWTKHAYANAMCVIDGDSVDLCTTLDEKRKKVNKIVSAIYTCIGIVEGDVAKLDKLMDGVCDLMDVLKTPQAESSYKGRKCDLFELFYGVPKPDHITVHPPEHVNTKGSGSRKKDRVESIAARALKPKRMCKKCGKLSHHDSRNCPNSHRSI